MNQTLRRARLALSLLTVLFLAAPSATGAEPDPASARPPTRKELEKQIKDAENRAKKLEGEARDDDRRANSWRRRAEDAERIGRKEVAAQNHKLADGFLQDALRRRKEAQEKRTEAQGARVKLAELKSGRSPAPVAGTGAPAVGNAGPVPQDTQGTTEQPPAPGGGVPAPGGPPKTDEPPANTPPKVDAPPGAPPAPTGPSGLPEPVKPLGNCPLPEGTGVTVRTRVPRDTDGPSHPYCRKFDRQMKIGRFTGNPDGTFTFRLQDLGGPVICTSPIGSCDGSCIGQALVPGSTQTVEIRINPFDFSNDNKRFQGTLIIRLPEDPFVIEFEGDTGLPVTASPYPAVLAGGLALIAAGAAIRRRRPETGGPSAS